MAKTTTRFRLLIAAGVLATAGTMPANAALFTQVYIGTVTSGYDGADIFKAGQILDGLSYTVTYLIDDAKGYSSFSPGHSQIYGGGIYDKSASPVSATLTINDESIDFTGLYQAIISQSDSTSLTNYPDQGYSNVSDYSTTSMVDSYIYNQYVTDNSNPLSSSDFRIPLDYEFTKNDWTYGYFNFSGGKAWGNFNIARIVTSPVAAVPEPASWALMVGGFGIAGGALRRRPRRIAVTA